MIVIEIGLNMAIVTAVGIATFGAVRIYKHLTNARIWESYYKFVATDRKKTPKLKKHPEA